MAYFNISDGKGHYLGSDAANPLKVVTLTDPTDIYAQWTGTTLRNRGSGYFLSAAGSYLRITPNEYTTWYSYDPVNDAGMDNPSEISSKLNVDNVGIYSTTLGNGLWWLGYTTGFTLWYGDIYKGASPPVFSVTDYTRATKPPVTTFSPTTSVPVTTHAPTTKVPVTTYSPVPGHGLSIGDILGIIFGSIAGTGVLIAIVYFMFLRKPTIGKV